jgi:hypothetical protein
MPFLVPDMSIVNSHMASHYLEYKNGRDIISNTHVIGNRRIMK